MNGEWKVEPFATGEVRLHVDGVPIGAYTLARNGVDPLALADLLNRERFMLGEPTPEPVKRWVVTCSELQLEFSSRSEVDWWLRDIAANPSAIVNIEEVLVPAEPKPHVHLTCDGPCARCSEPEPGPKYRDHNPDHPFGCPHMWGPPVGFFAADMLTHHCNQSRHKDGQHECKCGSVEEVPG